MKTIIIYDNNGTIFSIMSGSYIIPQGGIQYLEVDVPENHYVAGIEFIAGVAKAKLQENRKSEVTILQEQVDALNIAIAQMMGV